jgi:hypothetical protein
MSVNATAVERPRGRKRWYARPDLNGGPTAPEPDQATLDRQSARPSVARRTPRRFRSTGTAEEQFWARVEKGPRCWLWIGRKTSLGYGLLTVDGKAVYAHRFSWELHNGPIPPGISICHRCDVPGCVRPDDLFPGTQKQNIQDAVAKGRMHRGETTGTAKLTEAQVAGIKALLRSGAQQKDAAERFGVSRSAIQLIAAGKRWKNVS